jgi:hypothetical protein
MDVMNVEQAKIAEEAGASAIMALGTFPALTGTVAADDQSESPPTLDAMVVSHEWYAPLTTFVTFTNISPTPV